MELKDVRALVAAGESETLEFKKSTAQLARAGETLCAFLNARGGQVLIGIKSNGEVVGQQVADSTLRDIAAMIARFEPPAQVDITPIPLGSGLQVLALRAMPSLESIPFAFNGRAYHRVGSTTSIMPQQRYQSLLLERAHVRSRWENQPAVGVQLDDLDREEILRTRETAILQRRISAGTSTDVADVLDRMGLRRDGVITQAAQMLYGTRFLPDYPQSLLKMARFRGTKITGDILDNKHDHLHAFAMVREAISFLDRTLPLAAHFPKGEIFRKDRLPVPPGALREIILNAVMHRDYSDPGGYVAIAIFDDRIEIRSVGRLPRGITTELLSLPHRSILTNPLIADAFHLTGAVETWGRGTNRVIEECEKYGIEPPTFEQQSGAITVTFPARIGPGIDQARPPASDLRANLTPRQGEILNVIAIGEPVALRNIILQLVSPPASATVRDDLYHLKKIGLIDVKGRGRGATWFLRRA